MKRTYLIAILLYGSISIYGQKKQLDTSAFSSWPILTPSQISNDGKFVLYTIGSSKIGIRLMIQSTENLWKKEILRSLDGRFTEDSHRLIFSVPGDSIGILDLAKDSLRFINGLSSFATPKEGNGQWLAYLLVQPERELVLLNLFTEKEEHFPNVTGFEFDDSGKTLVIQRSVRQDSIDVNTIMWVNLGNEKKIIIGNGYKAMNWVFDKAGEQIAFLTKDEIKGQNIITLRYYKRGMDSATILVGPSTSGTEGMRVSILRNFFFSPNGSHIFFYLERRNRQQAQFPNAVKVNIRNYLDDNHENEILREDAHFLSVIQTITGKNVIQLQKAHDTLFNYYENCLFRDDYVLLEKDILDIDGIDNNKISSTFHDIYLISCKDGARILIKKRMQAQSIQFSPTGKYLCWYDEQKNQWVAYNMALAISKNITTKIEVPLSWQNDRPRASAGCYPLVGWLEADKAVFIQDRYDTWQVDLDRKMSPINVTNEYGRRHHIQLQYLDFNPDHPRILHIGDTLLFSAFNQSSKMNGFFQVILGRDNNPEKLIMEPKMYFHNLATAFSSGSFHPFFPVKAKFANIYMLECMSASEYPNLYVSSDLKEFRPLTHLEPQKEYNWFTTELHHWKLPNGSKEVSGILYKPENFDMHKKYPVLFYYYEKNSDALNYFIHPVLSMGAINIPWLVSNDYLVFVPDIFYQIGYPGQSAYNSVVSAVSYLRHLPYVDNRHMGLQGHSFGAFETNYIVSHSHLFAAAAPSAGLSDLISASASLTGKRYYEYGQGRIGASLWKRPDLYIENSPVFRADKVTTPLLIMQNRSDISVIPFSQADEWYYGLVREGKKVWMLSYDGEGHILQEEQNKLDYSIRVMQFFDHFLKGAKAPKWMTIGVDPHMKGSDSGLEYDNSGKNP